MKKCGFTEREIRILKRLNTPARIQDFLDKLPYNHDDTYDSPRVVLRKRKVDCFSGAIFAAAALRVNGHEPLIVDLRAERDDDHELAVFRVNGMWGAIGKSKFTGLKYREPIFKSIRELILSYFEFYYNYAHQKTLREYSKPLNLKIFDKAEWMTTEKSLKFIAKHLDKIRHFRILPKKMKKLRTVDKVLFKRGIIERKK